MDFRDTIEEKLTFLYDKKQASELTDKITKLVRNYSSNISSSRKKNKEWSQDDAVLITYGDVVMPLNGEANKLQTLRTFVNSRLGDIINTIHILPFFPSSSDHGFSVIDYKTVRSDLGQWKDVKSLSADYSIMADLVINHTSRFSRWFENYQKQKNPGKGYFIEINPETDLSDVTRPRNSSLLTTVKTKNGLRYVWTTFSDDQIDLNFSNPEVLLEFIDIFLFYISQGITIIRMDAIAYLWKKAGTNSIHLEETHKTVKLFRDIVDFIDEDVTLITETNVPFKENISYFGEGDEAHMVYQFSLPPLLLHAILTENSTYLTKWAAEWSDAPGGCTYFNFTASHDGIGVRPLEGLVPDEEFQYLVEGTKERGGFVSYKTNPDGTQSPYELNITYFDAFSEPGEDNTDRQISKYLCSQLIMLSLKGVPGIYFHNLIGTHNYIEGTTRTGEKRAINRKQWEKDELNEYLDKSDNDGYKVFNTYKKYLKIRKQQPAFSPEAAQEVPDLGNKIFGVYRNPVQDDCSSVFCICNITGEETVVPYGDIRNYVDGHSVCLNILEGNRRELDSGLRLEPFETVWLEV